MEEYEPEIKKIREKLLSQVSHIKKQSSTFDDGKKEINLNHMLTSLMDDINKMEQKNPEASRELESMFSQATHIKKEINKSCLFASLRDDVNKGNKIRMKKMEEENPEAYCDLENMFPKLLHLPEKFNRITCGIIKSEIARTVKAYSEYTSYCQGENVCRTTITVLGYSIAYIECHSFPEQKPQDYISLPIRYHCLINFKDQEAASKYHHYMKGFSLFGPALYFKKYHSVGDSYDLIKDVLNSLVVAGACPALAVQQHKGQLAQPYFSSMQLSY